MDRASMAALRLLVAVAKADGHVDEAEMEALRQQFQGDEGLLEKILLADIDIAAEVAAIPESQREAVYRACFTLAYVNEHMAHDEVAVLEQIWPNHDEDSLLEEVLNEMKDTLLPSNIVPVADPSQRSAEIEHDTLKYAIISAIVGAIPMPLVPDIAVVAIQVKLVRDIGQYWGHPVGGAAARSLVATAGGAIGMRIAVNGLFRMVPGFGSAISAGTSFASTYAIGQVADRYFAGGKHLSDDDIKDLFKKAKQQGNEAYKVRKSEIDEQARDHGTEIQALAKAAADGEISTLDFEQRVLDAMDDDRSSP